MNRLNVVLTGDEETAYMSRSGMSDKQVEEFIHELKEKGQRPEEIVEALKKKGYKSPRTREPLGLHAVKYKIYNPKYVGTGVEERVVSRNGGTMRELNASAQGAERKLDLIKAALDMPMTDKNKLVFISNLLKG